MSRLSRGVQAGLLAGAFVAAFFFVTDLVRLSPLSTPAALSRLYIPGAVHVDAPGLSQIVGIVTFGARILVLTALHLGVFALLGAGAVALFDRLGWPLNAGSGAVYGLIVYSLVFYGAMASGDRGVIEGVPRISSVAIANILAGGIMGAFLRRFPPGRRGL